MSKRDEQIARMKGLMTYGTTNTSKKTPITESIEGPDGNIYAVIREGTKFYIKSTPKGSELVAESFGYIGGFMNKKNNEFSSYNQAAKNLELKVRSLNEAYGVNKTVELHNPEKKETLMVEMTDAMKASLARYRQIVNEASAISASNTGVPEAPKTTGFSPKLGGPFTGTAEAILDKDLKATASKPENQGEPFGDNEKAEEFKDAQYVPDGSVANKKPAGGKVVRVNENEIYEETIEECDEWGSCGLPSSAGTGEIGDDAPFTETLKENDDKEDENKLPDPPEVVYIDGLNEDAGDADDFAGMPTTTESEDESDIDLDDIDLDLDTDEPEADVELDDIDTEEKVDDEGEESELEALRTEVEELRELINQLMGDDEESSFELELDDEYDDDEMPEDEYDDYEEDEDEMFHESRKYVQKLVEDVVQYYGVDKMTDAQRKRREETNDLQYSPYGDVCWDKAIVAIRAYGEKVREELKAEYEGQEEDVRFRRLWDGSVKREEYAINCLRNLYRLQYNVRAMRKDGALDETTLKELLQTITLEHARLVKNTEGIEDPSLADVISTAEGLIFRVENDLETLQNGSELDANLGTGDDYDVEYDDSEYEEDEEEEEVPVAPKKPAKTDKDFDDAATRYAMANNDPLTRESRSPRRLNEEGTKLNVFGKHPGYRKKPMSLPQTGSDEGDWNDSSVYSEQPFGQQIGDSAPFEKVLKSTVETVMENLKKKL
jgi:hypothetical protein